MIYFLEGNELEEQQPGRKDTVDFRPCLADFDEKELWEESERLQLHRYFMEKLFSSQSCKFESHEGFDFVSLCLPDERDLRRENHKIGIYYRSSLLVFVHRDGEGREAIGKLLHTIKDSGIRTLSLERILFEFFDQLTVRDSERLADMEREIFGLEEALISEGDEQAYIPKIIDLRRRLLVLKRYYEQLLDIAEAIEENQNDLLSGSIVKAFHLLTSRTDRLMDGVLNLRDYISQVREAYQAQVDIRQNQIMKLFTVLTAIFMPLTLIAGWYGMNLKIPEFQWVYAYPAVICVSIAIVIGCCFYFKKNKWF